MEKNKNRERVRIIDVKIDFNLSKQREMERELVDKLQKIMINEEKKKNSNKTESEIIKETEETIDEINKLNEEVKEIIENKEQEKPEEEPKEQKESGELEEQKQEKLEESEQEQEESEEQEQKKSEEQEQKKSEEQEQEGSESKDELRLEIDKMVNDNYVVDPVDEFIDWILKNITISRQDLSDRFNGVSGSKLSGVVSKIKRRLSEKYPEYNFKRTGKKNVIYKLEKKNDN